MFRIKVLDDIDGTGLSIFPSNKYTISDFSSGYLDTPDAYIVRSCIIKEESLLPSLKAIARAGAGTNNIAVDSCTEKGIVVFNTPGANANSVAELTTLGILLAARNVIESVMWMSNLTSTLSIVPQVEAGKAQFTGCEIRGKALGVIGLGAIGTLVANNAASLGMKVIGYDPHLPFNLDSPKIERVLSLTDLLHASDFVTVHVPATTENKGMFNATLFNHFERGAIFLNFSRAELVNEKDLYDALTSGHIARYVTDFPVNYLINVSGVIFIPHLGASTFEAKERCEIMAVWQLREFLENGNIGNSVNFPTCHRDRIGAIRIIVANFNRPGVIQNITTVLAANGANIAGMANESKGEIAYNIIDLDSIVDGELEDQIRKIENVTMARIIK